MPQLRPIKKSCKKLNVHGKKSETIFHFILNSVSFFKGNKFHFHLDCDVVICVLNVEFDSFSEKKNVFHSNFIGSCGDPDMIEVASEWGGNDIACTLPPIIDEWQLPVMASESEYIPKWLAAESIFSLMITSSCFFNARRSFARRFWNQILTWKRKLIKSLRNIDHG